MQLVTRVLNYLVFTKHYVIEFNAELDNSNTIFCPSSDSLYGNDLDTRRSTQGYVFTPFNGPIDWKVTKQRTVITSITETELLALTLTRKETLWWNRFFEAIDFDPGHQIYIQCDNRQTIRLLTSENLRLATKLRHVDIYQHWLRQEVQSKRIAVKWTSSADTLADGFTKALPTQRHRQFINQLGLIELNHDTTKSVDHEKNVSDNARIIRTQG